MPIYFLSEGVDFKLKDLTKVKKWITETVKVYDYQLGTLSIIFCNDAYLLQINQDYLNHTTLTDIITFNYASSEDIIEGEIYMSIERILENAILFDCPFSEEVHRVLIHGILHLIGFNDKTDLQKSLLRNIENFHLEHLRSTWNIT